MRTTQKDRSGKARTRPRNVAKHADAEGAPKAGNTSVDLTPAVGANLRRLRAQHELSLEKLAQASGVSRAMLNQIELQQSTPTINILWKIARALDVPFSALITQPGQSGPRFLPAARTKLLTSLDGRFSSRALFPFDEQRNVEFYELKLAAHAVEQAEAHSPGTVENLVLVRGAIEIRVKEESYTLAVGDAIQFDADAAHEYRNVGDEDAVMYLVMIYAERRR